MNGYIAFYNRGKREVYAPNSYAAQLEAAKLFGLPSSKSWRVSVVLAEQDGVQVSHDPAAVLS